MSGWGVPPWRVAFGALDADPPARAEVCVVGGGFSGLAAALALAAGGARVVLLEAERLGAGASGRTGGIALEGSAAGSLDGLTDCLDGLQRLLRNRDIACDLRLGGCWELVHRAPEAARPGPLAWRDGDALLQVEGRVPGGTLDPGALLGGLARAALAAGVSIHEGVPVRGLVAGSSPSVALERGTVACDRVVLGLNAYTRVLVPELEGLRTALTLAIRTTPLTDRRLDRIGLGEPHPFYTLDRPYLWGRTDASGRLVFGAGLTSNPSGDVRHLGLADPEVSAALLRLEGRVRGLHPVVAEVDIDARWGGPVAFRDGGLPLLTRHPSIPRVWITGAYGGHGVALSLRIGALAAASILRDAPLPAWGALCAPPRVSG